MVLHYIQFETISPKGINWHHFTQKPKLLIGKHGLNKPGHGVIRERWLFSPDASNIAMEIHVTLFTLLLASHHVGTTTIFRPDVCIQLILIKL